MYGKRAVVAFKTNRAIAAGEEITIDYGTEYFNAHFPCKCDAFKYPHTSETYRRRVSPEGDVSMQGFKLDGLGMKQPLFAPMRKSVKRGPIARSPETEEVECESGPDSACAEVAAPKVKRRRTCLAPYCRSLSRSARTSDNIVSAGQPLSTTKFFSTKQPMA